MTKVYYCPKCHRKTYFDKKYVSVICTRCQEEMFIIFDGKIKSQYVVEVKSDGRTKY